MAGSAIWLAIAAALTTGCLRDTEFKCMQDSDCGAAGSCESVGYCSVPDPQCTGTGRSFSDSAGQGLSSTCVPTSAGMQSTGCPSDHVSVADSKHRYKRLPVMTWDQARTACAQAGAAAYLLVPDDATELKNLASIVTPPFWIGLDDHAMEGVFVTPKNVPAMFLPWASGEPSTRPGQDCVRATSATRIATDACSARRIAICECEP